MRFTHTGFYGHVASMFFAALLIPGAFAFMPGRTLWRLFFGG